MGRESEINGHTQLYGLIGNPIGHTFSPMIHNTLAELTGRDLVYCPLPVARPEGLEAAVRGAWELGIQGMNVTVPYKSAVIPFLAEIDPVAEAIGAVNTLVRTEKGYKGYNTDYVGLWRALEDHGIRFPRRLAEAVPAEAGFGTVPGANNQAAAAARNQTSLIRVRNVVILGAGGAARAAGFLCGLARVQRLTVLNRTPAKAEALAADLRREFPGMEVQVLALKDAGRVEYEDFLAIQSTKVGLYPQVNDVPTTSATFYRRVQAGYDCIYNPEETRFLAEVHKRKKPGWSGLDMLLWQGIASYQYWTGLTVTGSQAQQVRENIGGFLRKRNRGRNFVLIGFMGSGKTTVGEALARTLGWQQEDTDQLIEKEAGKTIAKIFHDSGEEGFREDETRLLQRMTEEPERYFSQNQSVLPAGGGSAPESTAAPSGRGTGAVISTGGGIVLKEENRRLLHQLGTVVLLDVQPPTVVARIGRDSSRPLLQGKDRLRKVSALLARRQPAYHEAADLVIDTDGKTPDEIAEEILRRTQ